MDTEMQGVFGRADELTRDFIRECETCAQAGEVSERAKNLFHEVLAKVRVALDFAMNRVFSTYTSLAGRTRTKAERNAGFPICAERSEFTGILKSLGVAHLEQSNPGLYAKLLQAQPFSSGRDDLLWFRVLSNLGKHARLPRMVCRHREATKVTRPDGSMLIYTKGSGSVDRDGKLVAPPPDCDVQDITWVMFEVDEECGQLTPYPAVICLSLCQDMRSYVRKLLALL